MAVDQPEDGTSVALRHAFGRVLQELRCQKGVSQEQLGFEVGFHRTYISMLERGVKSPSLGAIFRLAKTLNVSPSELIRRVEVRVSDDSVSEPGPL